MADVLRLELLGGLRLTQGGVPLPHVVATKAAALLCYLALTRRPQSRTELAALLWGELSDADARNNLRVVLTTLRHSVGAHLSITRETIAFNRAGDYWLDVEEFERALSGATPVDVDRLRAAVALYGGDLLSGFFVREAPTFESGSPCSASACIAWRYRLCTV